MGLDRKTLGRSQLDLSVLGFGGTGLGNMYVAMSEHSVIDTLSAAHAAGVRYYDTAPLYGHGLSELRLGGGLRLFDDPAVICIHQGRLAAAPGLRQTNRRRPVPRHCRFFALRRLQLRWRHALLSRTVLTASARIESTFC